jgi:hypothetical protein
MKRALSPPVQLAMTITLIGTVVSLLQPEPVDLPPRVASANPTPATPRQDDPAHAEASASPWQRPQWPDPVAAGLASAASTSSDVPPLPPASTLAASATTPPLPSNAPPAPPATPDIVYLGRMIQDNKIRIFFASNGGDPVVLGAGEILNGSWKIQSVTSRAVTLTHLRSGEIRQITMGGGQGDTPRGGNTTQVGQHFLASNPAGVHVQPVN